MYKYAIGLDIGVASVGWAALAIDDKENPCGIINMGSRIFEAAEHPKTGESLAAPRREARSSRRRLRRHKHRLERIRGLFIELKVLTPGELETLFSGKLEDIYYLRVKALDEQISAAEFARVLIHISQRRGFRSNRKNLSDKDDGRMLAAVNENQTRMLEHGYRTVGEMLYRDSAFSEHKRNKNGSYITTVTRDMIEDEVKLIFASQREHNASFASEKLEADFIAILLSQRSFDDGPGGNSPYAGNQIEKMVGHCTFEKEEPRAAKATYSFEYFTLLEHVNNIRLVEKGSTRALFASERNALISLAHRTDELNYLKIRKELEIPETYLFKNVHYSNDKALADSEKREKFRYLRSYHEIKKVLDNISKGRVTQLSRDELNVIGTTLTLHKSSEKIRQKLVEAGLETADIDIIETMPSFNKFGHLSIKACEKLIPFLECGMSYNDACKSAGYEFRSHGGEERSKFLHSRVEDFSDITNPVVKRAVSQTIKVLNAIIRDMDRSPMFINIELARELSKDLYERKEIEREYVNNRTDNERRIQRIRDEYGTVNPSGLDLVKLKLFEEQGGVCAYSLKQMSMENLFKPGYAEIDHIIPYSISFDDGYKNKVLVLTEENRNKRNRLPLEYLSGKKKDDFIVWTQNNVRDWRKRQNLLREKLSDEDERKYKERALQDTKYISRFMMNYINDHLLFDDSDMGRKKRVTAVNGTVTAYMRKRWGITKIREDGDLHHAVDAVVICCTTEAMIQQVSRFASIRECNYIYTESESIAVDQSTGEALRKFPYPWNSFRKELEARLTNDPLFTLKGLKLPFYQDPLMLLKVRPLFVSRMPNRKVSGAAHKDTVKGAKAFNDGFSISKRPLTDLKLDKSGEIANYYMPQSDRLLYEALKKRLLDHGGIGSKAFAEPFYKPKHDGTPGALVKKVKLLEKTTLSVNINGGEAIADNDKMVRIDVFLVKGEGYYFVPIYVADTLKDRLPVRACIAHKPYSEWKQMSDDNFVFSLYPNDVISVTHKKGIKLTRVFDKSTLPPYRETMVEMLYYKGANISTGAISCINHDNTYKIEGLGIKTLKSIVKYSVDVLGELHEVKSEMRQPFKMKRG